MTVTLGGPLMVHGDERGGPRGVSKENESLREDSSQSGSGSRKHLIKPPLPKANEAHRAHAYLEAMTVLKPNTYVRVPEAVRSQAATATLAKQSGPSAVPLVLGLLAVLCAMVALPLAFVQMPLAIAALFISLTLTVVVWLEDTDIIDSL